MMRKSGSGASGTINKSIVAVFVALLISLTAACASENGSGPIQSSSGGSDEMTVAELVRLSGKATMQAESARTSMTMSLSGQGDVPSFLLDSEGAQDFATGDSEFTMSLFDQELEARTIGTTMYQKWPEEMLAQSGLPEGKTWISTDLEEQYRKQTGLSLESLQNEAASSPTGQLEYLRSVGSAKKVGEEPLRGTPTTRYRAVVDLDRELAAVRDGAQDAKALKKAYENLKKQLGTSKLPMDVWLDDQGRVRRYVMSMPVPPPATGNANPPAETTTANPEVSITVELYDYGVPVEVAAPPEEKTISDKEVLTTQNQSA